MALPIIPIASLDVLRHMTLLQIIPQANAEIENALRDAALDADGPGLAGLHAGHLVEGAKACAGAVDFVRGLLPVVVEDPVPDDEVVGPAFRAAGVVVDGVGGYVVSLAVGVGALAALVLRVVACGEAMVGIGGDWCGRREGDQKG